MTLIAAVGLDTYPVVFGDLLISRPAQPGAVPNIALVGEGTNFFPAGSEGPILGVNQKVVLLGDHCVIAWAGNIEYARTVITELRAMASNAPLSLPIIETYLSQLDPTVRDEVSFIGWVKDGELFHQFWYRAAIAKSEMFGQVSAGGSGATDFVTLASEISGGTWNAPGRVLTGLERAISSMLSATSLLLQAELSSQSSVLHYFGGGYEIATFIGDKFAKVGDIAFVFWMAHVTDGQVALSGPWFVLKQDYAGESLLLHLLLMRPGEMDTDPPIVEEHQQVISPFGGTVDAAHAAGISWPGLEATFTCHVALVHLPKSIAVFDRIDYSESRAPMSIRFSLEASRISFEVNPQFAEELTQSIRAVFVDS
jgi:hypothetical protein